MTNEIKKTVNCCLCLINADGMHWQDDKKGGEGTCNHVSVG